MRSLILGTTTNFLIALLLLFSFFLLLRGHNLPGGGFGGGLVASASFALYALAYGVNAARKLLRFDPRELIGGGLLIAILSGLLAPFFNKPFLTGMWDHTPVPVIGKLGTPLFFDVGVYLVVMGFALLIIFSLFERKT